jgi:transposase InsO family protein
VRMSPTPPADQAGGGIDSGPAARTGSASGTCVDHIVVLGEAHLRQTLREYARYYNTARTHRSLDQDAPVSRHV